MDDNCGKYERKPSDTMSINFPAAEEEILQKWREIGAFQRQLELSNGRKPYTFYDGPPFGMWMNVMTWWRIEAN